MTDLTESEVIEVGDLDPEQWNDYAEKQGWSDGMPLMVPTEKKGGGLGSNLPRRQRAVSADAAAPCHSDNAKHCCQCCDGGLPAGILSRRRDGRPGLAQPRI
jgi:hypothetical protein